LKISFAKTAYHSGAKKKKEMDLNIVLNVAKVRLKIPFNDRFLYNNVLKII